MARTIIKTLILAALLLFLQVAVFNRICLFGVAVPFVYIYVLLRLPLGLNNNWALTLAFVIGGMLDVFSDTPGMNGLAALVMTGVRKPVASIFMPRDFDLVGAPLSGRIMGFGGFARYTVIMTAIYCTIFFAVETLRLFSVGRFVMAVLCSTILSSLLVICIDVLTASRRGTRL